ncbi:ERG2 and sigma1 receptor-like protein [Hypoxylon trugodes]|uniref:ERG2 and sigma1 receptor-like protein n=1 Tax=Hypoxylon trugodes TaxID=326681 RepID=UPI002194D049|nr:ERG2 and sigma1 receptor-like protein [Hypoxylon trugodes]KAI1390977.1 ERG2 and sigma1 receptor-like protein [Hypoxylon trugodes]
MAPNKSKASSGGGCSCSLTKVLTIIGALIGLFFPIYYILERNLEKFYIFELDHLKDVSSRGIEKYGNDTGKIVEYIVAELHEKYPRHVNPKWNVPEEWFFNNAGGAMGGMYIIHSSITEYLIIFGTAVGTEGHSGRHTADDYFYILSGEQWAYVPGNFTREVYPAGAMNHMHRGTVKQYKMPNDCFALEYARGWIPPMLFFGFADGVFSTLDVQTLYRTVVVTGREMIANLLIGKI